MAISTRTARGRRGRARTPPPGARPRRRSGWCPPRSPPASAGLPGSSSRVPSRRTPRRRARPAPGPDRCGGREAHLAAALVAADHHPVHPEHLVAELTDPPEVTLVDGVTDQRRGTGLRAVGEQRHRVDHELPRPELRQQVGVTGGTEAEAEVLPDHDPRGCQRSQHPVDELLGTPPGHFGGEVEHHHLVDPRLVEQLPPASSEQSRRGPDRAGSPTSGAARTSRPPAGPPARTPWPAGAARRDRGAHRRSSRSRRPYADPSISFCAGGLPATKQRQLTTRCLWAGPSPTSGSSPHSLGSSRRHQPGSRPDERGLRYGVAGLGAVEGQELPVGSTPRPLPR